MPGSLPTGPEWKCRPRTPRWLASISVSPAEKTLPESRLSSEHAGDPAPRGLAVPAPWLPYSHDLRGLYPGQREETQRQPWTPLLGRGRSWGVCMALPGTVLCFLRSEIHPHVGEDFSLSVSLWRRRNNLSLSHFTEEGKKKLRNKEPFSQRTCSSLRPSRTRPLSSETPLPAQKSAPASGPALLHSL